MCIVLALIQSVYHRVGLYSVMCVYFNMTYQQNCTALFFTHNTEFSMLLNIERLEQVKISKWAQTICVFLFAKPQPVPVFIRWNKLASHCQVEIMTLLSVPFRYSCLSSSKDLFFTITTEKILTLWNFYVVFFSLSCDFYRENSN